MRVKPNHPEDEEEPTNGETGTRRKRASAAAEAHSHG
jgi:hypothetical protein